MVEMYVDVPDDDIERSFFEMYDLSEIVSKVLEDYSVEEILGHLPEDEVHEWCQSKTVEKI